MTTANAPAASQRSISGLQGLNFFVADIQTGVGPFLATYLAAQHWSPRDVGFALTLGGLITVFAQTPAGAYVDAARSKRALLATAIGLCAFGAVLVALDHSRPAVAVAQLLIGLAGAFLMPTLGAITMGLVGDRRFDRQFGKNQSFNSAGNVVTALLLAAISHYIGDRYIFITAALLAVPAFLALAKIRPKEIDFDRARGDGAEKAGGSGETKQTSWLQMFRSDRVLLTFFCCATLFHLANAAMLPQLGELLSKGQPTLAAPFMSACIIVTQVVITLSAAWVGKASGTYGRRPLLLLAFGVLPARAVLYTITHSPALLIAIQVLDGVANSIFGVVSILVIADRLRHSGRFNLGQGALGTMVGLGAACSATLGGLVVEKLGFNASFLALGAVATVAFGVLYLGVPETRGNPTPESPTPDAYQAI